MVIIVKQGRPPSVVMIKAKLTPNTPFQHHILLCHVLQIYCHVLIPSSVLGEKIIYCQTSVLGLGMNFILPLSRQQEQD